VVAASWKVGADDPLLVNTCPEVPTAVTPIALVPLPKSTPFAVSVLAPVPPSATARSVIPVIEPPSMLIDDRATVPATTSAVWLINSRTASFTSDGFIVSDVFTLPTSVLFAAVAE
jgi:hypothetical protein